MNNNSRLENFLTGLNQGNISQGRPNLGFDMPVWVYRLMQYTLRSTLEKEYGTEKADALLYDAGRIAGAGFCSGRIGRDLPLNDFLSAIQRELKENRIAIFRVERHDPEKMHFFVTLAEDLDCSGLPLLDEAVCSYDEGFLAGVMTYYTGRDFEASEVDCWATGERVCRFEVKPSDGSA